MLLCQGNNGDNSDQCYSVTQGAKRKIIIILINKKQNGHGDNFTVLLDIFYLSLNMSTSDICKYSHTDICCSL